MKGFNRTDEPTFLRKNAALWNDQWYQLKSKNPGAKFQWYKHGVKPVNQLLRPILESQTQDHCSYCDGYPPLPGDDTIDHFRPKSRLDFARLAYAWSNLYIACNACQRTKLEAFSEDLLAPDAYNFSFDRYFIYEFATHKILPNPDAGSDEQLKAETTIRLFGLNDNGHIINRRHTLERWRGKSETDSVLDDFAHRFMLL